MKTKMNFKYYFLLLGILFYLPIYAQSVSKVKGMVTDESGVPLPGVSVIIKNTTKGTATDFDGNYTLDVNSKDILVFSFLGFKTHEVAVVGKSTINISLKEDSNVLDEVVVVGYGTTTRRDVTGSISSVSGADIARVPVADAAQALQGKLPGVNVVSQDGRPGAEVSIRVRGGGSISQSNDPLFIVDGFPVSSISSIPGNQIQSIDVLKDASSTAIYGARGANGVIIITTKSGKSGKTTVSYDGYTQFNTPTGYLPVMDSYDYILYNWAYAQAISDSYANAWEKLWLIGNEFKGANTAGIDHYKTVSSENFSKQVYKSSFSHNHNFNISSGTENTRYIFAVNHLNQEGMKLNSGYERTNASFKLDQKLGDKLNFSLNTRYSQIEQRGNEGTGSSGGSNLSTAFWFRPVATSDVLGDLDINSNTLLGDYNSLLQDLYNPVNRINDFDDVTLSRSLVANSSLSWEIIEGLTAKTDIGLSTNNSRRKQWEGAIYSLYYTKAGEKTYSGNARIRANQGWNYRWANTLNYQIKGLGANHKASVLAGMEVADSGSEYTEVWGDKYPVSYNSDRAFANMQSYLVETIPIKDPHDGAVLGSRTIYNGGFSSNTGTPNRLNSYFGRANYSYMDKYLLTATFRADGSSRFAPSNRWGYFPAGAIAWRASEETFLNDISWLNDLKVRLSYGSVGSDQISANLWTQSWAASNGPTRYSINGVQQSSYVPASSTIANPNLKWETTITRNLGFDFALFNNKLTGTIDLYKNTVKDLLLLTPVSAISGFSYTYDNIGATSNKGVEISFSGDIIASENFNLRGSVNVNVNKGNVDELAEGINGTYSSNWGGVSNSPRSGDYILKVGKPVGLIRGWVYDGWYTTDDFNYDGTGAGVYTLKSGVPDIASGNLATVYGTTGHKPGSQTAYPGVPKYKDISGPAGVPDGVVDENDLTIVGNTNPKHTGGFNLSGNYKAFDFALDFNWSVGNDIYNANHLNSYLGNKESGLFRNRHQELVGHYKIYDIVNGQITPVVDPASLDALNTNATTFLPYAENSMTSSFGVEDGSFLRLNTLTLGYTIPQSVVDKFSINRFRVYGSIYNVFTLTGYDGLDPEVNSAPNRNANYPTPGLDYGTYPRARSFTFGVNIEF